MARTTVRPGRTLAVFFLAMAILYGLVAIGGKWKPDLGLDLEGGTRITLIANGHPTGENLNEARSIIDQRVNGSGVAEASVTTQNQQYIVVEIPGKNRAELARTLERQAQLRFRFVACSDSSPGPCASATSNPSSNPGLAGGSAPVPGASTPAAPTTGLPLAPRAPLAWAAKKHATAAASPTAAATSAASTTAGASITADASTSSDASSAPSTPTGTSKKPQSAYDKAVAFTTAPDPASIAAFNAYTCPKTASDIKDDPAKPLVTCEPSTGEKYLLTPAIIEGTEVTGVSYGIPQNQVQYAVNLNFNGHARSTFANATGLISQTGGQFAIVLDGEVISAPTASSRISGSAQITGNFTQATAKSLATSLKYGALPISFKKDPTVETIGPSLAGDQLSAGLLAGVIGLLLVMVYCLLYYRGLGVVVIGSLIVAAAATYALVLLLSKTAGFTLTLPGIAGLIVAVGITGDSFIVYFERIRDEMRDGKSMRVAVQAGWKRARATTLAADAVSLLASVVLYIFAAGAVKGFAFALGLSTLVDLAIFFWFTHPSLTWLSGYRFFNRGHKLSGLDKEALGVVGGNA